MSLAIAVVMLICGVAGVIYSSYNAYVYGPWSGDSSDNYSKPDKPRDNASLQEKKIAGEYVSAHTLHTNSGGAAHLFVTYSLPPEMGSEEIVNNTVVLTKSVRYYKKHDGEYIFDYEIAKGTEIYALHPEYPLDFGYGFLTYPTIDKGWRYSKVFITKGEYADGGYNDFYRYVQLDDLKPIASVIYETNPFFELYADSKGYSHAWFRHAGMLLYVDNNEYHYGELYRNEQYYLPDLYNNTIEVWEIASLIIGLGVLTAHVRKWRKNRIR